MFKTVLLGISLGVVGIGAANAVGSDSQSRCLTLCGTGWLGVTTGPALGIFSAPIPKNQEDKHWTNERYDRVPILGQLTAGGPVIALAPPSDDEVMRALRRARPIEGGRATLHEQHRRDVRIVKEKIADYVDPERVVPLIGTAQLHHAHYKCTIYFGRTELAGLPAPRMLNEEDAAEVIYIDHNHFHMVGCTEVQVDIPRILTGTTSDAGGAAESQTRRQE